MPDDNLFPEKTGAGTGGETPPGDPPANGGDPAAGETPVTMAAAAELITQAISPLADRLEELGRTNAQLAQNLQTPQGNQAGGDPSPAPEDFLTRFSNDPEGAVRSVVGGEFQSVVPLVSSLINSTVSNFVSKESSDIDREFGAGAWDKFFEKPLGVLVDSYRKSNAPALADHNTIRREVDGLKGRQFDALVAFRDDSRKTATEKKEGGQKELVDEVLKGVQTNLTGGIRRISTEGEEVTEELKGYLAERSAAIGENIDPKAWLAQTNYGNTLEDYQAHQKVLEKARKKEEG
jgi:hypothetical protein